MPLFCISQPIFIPYNGGIHLIYYHLNAHSNTIKKSSSILYHYETPTQFTVISFKHSWCIVPRRIKIPDPTSTHSIRTKPECDAEHLILHLSITKAGVMEESVSEFLSSEVDACQQPSAPNTKICSEPFIPFFCCFYSIICSEKVEARVTMKFSLNVIPAVDCHQLNILCHYHPHCSQTNLILAKRLFVSLCFQLKTTEKRFDSNAPIFLLISHDTVLLDSVKHLKCIPPIQCVLLYSQVLSSAIHISLLVYTVGIGYFVCLFFNF